MTATTLAVPRPPARPAPTVRVPLSAMLAVRESLGHTTLATLGVRDSVTDDPGGVLYLNCGWAQGRHWTIRRVVITRLTAGVYRVADQVVSESGKGSGWTVRTVSEQDVSGARLSAAVRELAQARKERTA